MQLGSCPYWRMQYFCNHPTVNSAYEETKDADQWSYWFSIETWVSIGLKDHNSVTAAKVGPKASQHELLFKRLNLYNNVNQAGQPLKSLVHSADIPSSYPSSGTGEKLWTHQIIRRWKMGLLADLYGHCHDSHHLFIHQSCFQVPEMGRITNPANILRLSFHSREPVGLVCSNQGILDISWSHCGPFQRLHDCKR